MVCVMRVRQKAEERRREQEAAAKLQEEDERRQCTICTERDVDTVLVPCGHTMCGTCVAQLREPKTCPFCRNRCPSSIKFFLPT